MTKPDWCPQDVWEKALSVATGYHTSTAGAVLRHSTPELAAHIARALLEADRRNAETIRRLQANMSKMAMDWTKAMTRERLAGFAEGMERAAEIAEKPHEDDDRMDRQIRSDMAASIRAVAKEIEP